MMEYGETHFFGGSGIHIKSGAASVPSSSCPKSECPSLPPLPGGTASNETLYLTYNSDYGRMNNHIISFLCARMVARRTGRVLVLNDPLLESLLDLTQFTPIAHASAVAQMTYDDHCFTRSAHSEFDHGWPHFRGEQHCDKRVLDLEKAYTAIWTHRYEEKEYWDEVSRLKFKRPYYAIAMEYRRRIGMDLSHPYLAVHWRMEDYSSFCRDKGDQDCFFEGVEMAQLTGMALRRAGLKVVYLATNAGDHERQIYLNHLGPDIQVFAATPTWDIMTSIAQDDLKLTPDVMNTIDFHICTAAVDVINLDLGSSVLLNGQSTFSVNAASMRATRGEDSWFQRHIRRYEGCCQDITCVPTDECIERVFSDTRSVTPHFGRNFPLRATLLSISSSQA